MDYLVWDATYAGNACHVLGVRKVEYTHQLVEGYEYGDTFPKDAVMSMSPHFKKDTKLVDDVMNAARIKVCSKRLVDFLKNKNLKNVEYLPVTILDHKKKVASREYSIVNPIGLQDAIDMKASFPVLNSFDQTVDSVKKIVFDVSRIDPQVRLFRFAGLSRPVIIEKTLADELQAQGFVGLSFLDPVTVTS
jgi:hypothetical protein